MVYIEVGSTSWFDSSFHFKTNEAAIDTHIKIDAYLREHDYTTNTTCFPKLTYVFDEMRSCFSIVVFNKHDKIDERFTITIYRVNGENAYSDYVSFFSEIRSSLANPGSMSVYYDLKSILTNTSTNTNTSIHSIQ
jgi:hypothetical protein